MVHPSFQDLTGMRFGRLTVVSRVKNQCGNARWLCNCDCGGTSTVISPNLKGGRIKSCGCLRTELIRSPKTHGKSRTRAHKIWCDMRKRCNNSKHKSFDRYGGRGISVCDRWASFENFLADMGEPPIGQTIERKNNDGPYSPENCIWASRLTQMSNTSRTIRVALDGAIVSLSEACRRLGLNYSTVAMRIYRGSSLEDALK